MSLLNRVVPGCLLLAYGAAIAAPPVASAPASQPVLAEALVSRIRLAIPGRGDAPHYWLYRPAGHGPGQGAPLIICLHGTDDTAREALAFWSGLRLPVGTLIAAPQSGGKGWSDGDLPVIRAMMAHIASYVSHDCERVLLAGFSAGGTMALHLLYKEHVPVTAVAALANYLPPQVEAEDVRERASVPVFYAVGIDDVNHERMRHGIDLLRSAGGNVDLYRPPIGHVLDAKVGQIAVDWFFSAAGSRLDKRIADAPNRPAEEASLFLQEIVRQERWHDPRHVQAARAMLERVSAAGRAELSTARALANEHREIDACEVLDRVAATYGLSEVGREAVSLRAELLQRPGVRKKIAAREVEKAAEEAFELYKGAQRMVADGKYREAVTRCEHIVSSYPGTQAAERARFLKDVLRSKVPLEQ